VNYNEELRNKKKCIYQSNRMSIKKRWSTTNQETSISQMESAQRCRKKMDWWNNIFFNQTRFERKIYYQNNFVHRK